jgi:hypothetical protein
MRFRQSLNKVRLLYNVATVLINVRNVCAECYVHYL